MEKHDLIHEFPELKDKIHSLKVENHHFRKLFEDYHEINNDVHRIETGAENTEDEILNELRKKRLALKDELYAILQKPEQS